MSELSNIKQEIKEIKSFLKAHWKAIELMDKIIRNHVHVNGKASVDLKKVYSEQFADDFYITGGEK